MLTTSSGKHNVVNVTHQEAPGAACDAASVHFPPSIMRTDILSNMLMVLCLSTSVY